MDNDIALKAWEVFQGLAQGLGDSCWKIRSVFYTASSALIAYAFVHSVPSLYLVTPWLSLAFFILEGGYKQVQDQYIGKSLAIERTLNDILVDEPEPFIPDGGISTSITTPTIRKCFTTLRYRNFFFWIPYFVIIVLCPILWWFDVTARESAPKVALVTDASIEAKKEKSNVHSVPLSEWQRELTRMADSLDQIGKQSAAQGSNVAVPSVSLPPINLNLSACCPNGLPTIWECPECAAKKTQGRQRKLRSRNPVDAHHERENRVRSQH